MDPTTPTAKAQTRAEVDTNSNTIRLRRSIAAPAARVFEAWTTPEILARWWDPDGHPLRECTVDLRPGGSFRFVHATHGDGFAFEGTYSDIAPPDRLAFDAMGAKGQVEFVEHGGRTEITVSIACASAEHLTQFLSLGVADNTGRTLDNLVTYFEAA